MCGGDRPPGVQSLQTWCIGRPSRRPWPGNDKHRRRWQRSGLRSSVAELVDGPFFVMSHYRGRAGCDHCWPKYPWETGESPGSRLRLSFSRSRVTVKRSCQSGADHDDQERLADDALHGWAGDRGRRENLVLLRPACLAHVLISLLTGALSAAVPPAETVDGCMERDRPRLYNWKSQKGVTMIALNRIMPDSAPVTQPAELVSKADDRAAHWVS